MHFLICVAGEQYSRDTLLFGIRLAAPANADVSILSVRPTISHRFRVESRIAREKLEEWQMETPEARIVMGVEDILLKEGFLRTVEGSADVRHMLKAGIQGAYEYHLYGKSGQNVRIRVREGDVVGNILKESRGVPYDLVIIGAPRDGGRLVRHIIQYVETSVLIVKDPRDVAYRLLLCLNDSKAARKAEDFTIRIAQFLDTAVDILCIYSYPWEEHAALDLADSARRVFRRARITHSTRIRRGPVDRTILREMESDHIVVMGTSERSSLYQLFFGSNPVRIGRLGKSPVLVVK